LPAITAAEIKPIAGTWFNAEEPSLFELARKNGEAVATQYGQPFVLSRLPGGRFGVEHGTVEFKLKPATGGLRVDLGAGRVLTFKKLDKRKGIPAGIAGTYVSADSGAVWKIKGDKIEVSGPLVGGGPAWTIRGIDSDTVETISSASWLQATQLAHLVRDKSGKIAALEVSTGRIKMMRFDKIA